MSEQGMIFNIQRFCVDDGPGIRTTVFFKGCPLRCVWCHNPESASPTPDILFSAQKCIGCGYCAAVCPHGLHRLENGGHVFVRDGCEKCGLCAEKCYAKAIEFCGHRATVDEVMGEVVKDADFYETSGGGLTVSGGEPLMQAPFLLALLGRAKAAGIHTCVETSGFAAEEIITEAAAVTDLFLFDYKITDPDEHFRYTGVPNAPILRNLQALDRLGAAVILRCPIIPDINMHPAHFEAIGRLAKERACIQKVELLPYHPLGISKCERLDKAPAYPNTEFLSAEALRAFTEQVEAICGKPVKCG